MSMKKYIYLILILLATTFIYSNHFDNQFHFDDTHTITDNLYIRELKNIPQFFKDATTTSVLPANQAYRPGLTMLNAIDFALAGKPTPEPFMFHLSIFICYLILGALCFFLFNHLLKISFESKNNDVIALFATAWFLFHTANAETINYIIARSDSFSTLMIVLSFILYIYLPKFRRFYLYALPALLGFFVKEPTIMFVPLLFVYKWLFEEKKALHEWFSNPKSTFKTAQSLIIPLVLFIGLFLLSRQLTPSTWQSGGIDRWRYLLTQPFVFFHYFYNFILPTNLAIDTDWTLISSYRDDRVLAGLLFISGLIYIAFQSSKQAKNAPITFGILWFFIALLPTSSIFPFSEVLNDHRPFFPYIGLFIASATLLRNWIEKISSETTKLAFLGLGITFLGLHAYGTHQRNIVWKTEESLWKDCTVNAPNNPRGWMNYGLSLMARGDYPTAIECFNKTVVSWGNYAPGYINLAVAKAATGDFATAEVNFKKGLELDTMLPDAYHLYGKFLSERGRNQEANAMIEKGLAISPKNQNLLNLSQKLNALSANKNVAETIQLIGKTPSAENYLDLSLQYYNSGDYQKCIEAAELALTFKPDYELALNNICAAHNRLGNWAKAIEAGEKGLKINPNNELLKGNLTEARKNIK
jgi:protein O-mannosyl-transferase